MITPPPPPVQLVIENSSSSSSQKKVSDYGNESIVIAFDENAVSVFDMKRVGDQVFRLVDGVFIESTSTYSCPNCGDIVRPVLQNRAKAIELGIRLVSHHFRHESGVQCLSGEKLRHFNAIMLLQHTLKKMCAKSSFIFISRKCDHHERGTVAPHPPVLLDPSCEVSIESPHGDFIFDVAVRRNGVVKLVFEVVATHPCEAEKWQTLRGENFFVVEVEAFEVLGSTLVESWNGNRPLICLRGLPECSMCETEKEEAERVERERKQGEPPELPPFPWTEEQLAALDAIENWYRNSSEPFFALTGPAGSGKSTLLREVVSRFPSATLTAMTGKAALRLSQLTGQSASTLHSKLYYPPQPGEDLQFTRLREPPSRLFVTDEASMMTPSVFNDLQNWDVRILLVGDIYQLPPVITGPELKQYGENYSVFSLVQGVSLKTVMRSAGGVLRAATKVRETGEICEQSDLQTIDRGEYVGYEYIRSTSPIEQAVNDYLSDREDHLLVTWRNQTRMNANRLVRDLLKHDGPLPDEGEPVLLKRNGQGHLNGEIVECGSFEGGPMIGSVQTLWMRVGSERLLVSFEGGNQEKGGVPFDGVMPWIQDWKKYHIDLNRLRLPEPIPITWGYVLTAHSSQGSEARRVTVFLCKGEERSSFFRKPTTLPSGEQVPFSARFIYTATTRGKTRSTMIVGR